MKIVVAHNSPDWDAITSVWVIKKFLPEWHDAKVMFVPAGERVQGSKSQDAIEKIGQDEVIHVDTGLGPLDHHQTNDHNVSAASLAWDYVKTQNPAFNGESNEEQSDKTKNKEEAISRIVKIVVDIDHFGEVFWENPAADYHEFSLLGLLDGIKLEKPDDDNFCIELGFICLDAMLHNFENRIWAEKEIAEKGKKFTTKWGEGMGFETINDTVIKLAQKMGYVLVIRKDPRKGYVRIKARPDALGSTAHSIDLTLVYEKLSKMDPDATWFLHVSKKMLLNGTVKNPKMRPTSLSLDEIIKVLEKV